MNDPSRRCFLTVLGGSALVCVGGCSSAAVGPEAIGDVSAGNVSALPVNTLHAVGSKPVAIGRDSSGVYAMTLTCPHQGVNMATDGRVDFMGGVLCLRHGSQFTSDGTVIAGSPATESLQHFAVELAATGELTIHGTQYVASSTRTPVT